MVGFMIISLMKIVPCRQYADCFLDGNLYCNTVRYFREEDYDEYEGAAFVANSEILCSPSLMHRGRGRGMGLAAATASPSR